MPLSEKFFFTRATASAYDPVVSLMTVIVCEPGLDDCFQVSNVRAGSGVPALSTWVHPSGGTRPGSARATPVAAVVRAMQKQTVRESIGGCWVPAAPVPAGGRSGPLKTSL